jgi:hypothetical protein
MTCAGRAREQRARRQVHRLLGLIIAEAYHNGMELQFTAVFRQVPEGYIGFVEELPGDDRLFHDWRVDESGDGAPRRTGLALVTARRMHSAETPDHLKP